MLYITIIISIISDLLSKYLFSTNLQNKINIIWDFLYLEVAKNTWIAFSINLWTIFLKILTLFLIILIFVYYFKEERKKHSKLIDLWYWLVIWWAIWNWFERIFNWFVIDFIWVKHFAIFNFADSFIFIWVCILLFINYRKVKNK